MDEDLRVVLLAVLLAVCLPAAGAAMDTDGHAADVPAGAEADAPSYSTDRLFVKGDPSLLDGLVEYDSAVPAWKGSQWSLVTLSEGEDAGSAEKILNDSGLFDCVERERMHRLPSVQAGSNGSGQEDTHLVDMRITEAWDHLESIGKPRYGSPDVVIAVIDSGMDIGHEALKDCLWTNPGEVPDNGIDDDGNGYVDDIHGWDFSLNSPSMKDVYSHGTHVTGIIAASPDSACPGVASGCSIMPLRVMQQTNIPEGAILNALEYAHSMGASVVNMSLGSLDAQKMYTEYIAEVSDDMLIVDATGNEGCCNNHEHKGLHATAVSTINMVWGPLGVMCTDQGGAQASDFTNYDDTPFGDSEYCTYAVGHRIRSTVPGGGYGYMSGTSMAAPMISGIAGLLLTADPDMTVPELRAAITMSGSVHPFNTITGEDDPIHTFCDVMDAFDIGRRADVGLMGFSGKQTDADGPAFIMDVSLLNRGFDARNAVCTMTVSDPYATVTSGSFRLDSMGPSSLVSRTGCLSFSVSEDCPSVHDFELTLTVSADGAQEHVFTRTVTYTRDTTLPAVIGSDLAFDTPCSVIIDRDTVIEAGATLRFGPECTVLFKEKEDGGMPVLTVRGGLLMSGEFDREVTLNATDGTATVLTEGGRAEAVFQFCNIRNMLFGGTGAGPVFRECAVGLDLGEASEFVFRIGSASQSQFWMNVSEVVLGDLQDSMLIVQHADHVRMEQDSRLCRTLVGIQTYGQGAAFHMAGEVDDCVFTDLSGFDPGSLVFDAAPDTVYDRVCFHGGLEGMSPFREDWCITQLSTDRIWPFVTSVTFVDPETGSTVGPEDLTASEYSVIFQFSRDVEMSDASAYLYSKNGAYLIEDMEMIDGDRCKGMMDLKGQPCHVGMIVVAYGWDASGDPNRHVPYIEGNTRVIISSDKGSTMPVEVSDIGGKAWIEWNPIGLNGFEGFSVDRYDSPDGEPESVCYREADDPFLYCSYIDEDVEPGRTYWYSVSHMDREGNRLSATAPSEVRIADTHPPVIVHQTQRDCMAGKDLKLSFTVTDDAELTCVMLKYRQIGTYEWQVASLVSEGERYTATIPGEQVKGDGTEYFIWASDSENFTFFGTSSDPIVCPLVTSGGTYAGLGALFMVFLATVPFLFLRRR